MIKVKNPILPGFYPDPSICRVGEDFYIVNSTFAYFPGVPVWHSKDLAHWQQIGNVLDRNSQLPLEGCQHSQGIFAPVIRYWDGVFYMITTNVSAGGNFIVTAKDPSGPWSEPYYLGEEAQGIDPSLFFDTDGTCYYVGTRPNPEGVRYNGDWEIWVQELDLSSMKFTGKSQAIWKGALKDVIWPEGPHLYKKDDYYYLMIAEGGTGPNHAVTTARSRNIWGPYENNPNNPILTHRHLGKDYPVIYVGHADLVDDTAGNWYMVMLASRRCEGYVGLGRETFLAKVVWEDGWPVVNPGVGKLEEEVKLPFDGSEETDKWVQTLDLTGENTFDIVKLRNTRKEFWHYQEGELKLSCLPQTLKELACPAYLGLRQLDYQYEAKLTILLGELKEGEEAGLVILQSNEYHILFRAKKEVRETVEQPVLQVVKVIKGIDQILGEQYINTNMLWDTKTPDSLVLRFMIKGHGQKADFLLLGTEGETTILEDVDVHEMSTEVAGGFVGNTIGVYATSNGAESDSCVYVKEFRIAYS